jgi:glycosyltransferase involved in cell wall biosynthesis
MVGTAQTTVEPPRVLQLIPLLRVGGLERVATTLSIALSDRGVHVTVCSKGGEPFEPLLLAAGVPVVHIPRLKPQLRALATSSWVLARVLRRERPDIVHAHNPTAAVAAAIARRFARLPEMAIVTTYHGVVPERVNRAAKTMAAASDLVVGVGPTSTQALLAAGLAPDRARTIHNAVAPATRRDAGAVRAEFDAVDAELVVTVGRYVAEKNQALLLEAVARLAPARPRLRLLIVGRGPLESALRERLATLGLSGIATVTGERADAVDITAAADVFALSSDSEGLPLALLEAMALGTSAVSTDAGGVRDALVDGNTGLLVPVGNAAALADALDRLLADSTLRSELTMNAAAYVERTCSAQAMTELYLELYSEVVARRRAIARRTGESPST